MGEVSEWYNTTTDGKVKSISIGNSVIKVGSSCSVCGKFVELNEWEVRHATFQLCDECIKAIKFAKALMKHNPNMNIDGDDGK